MLATSTSTPSPARARIRSRLARILFGLDSVDQSGHQVVLHISPACLPVAGPSPRCEKKRSGWQRVQRSERSATSDPGPLEQTLGDLRQIEHPAVSDAGSERGECLEHLRADLEAAGPDARADRRHRAIELRAGLAR